MPPRVRKTATGWSVRIRYGEREDSWIPLAVAADDPALAEARRKRLQRMATLLRRAGKIAESRTILEQAASERSERAFRNVEAVVEGFSPEPAAEEKGPATFREVAEAFWSGTLQDEHPDSFKQRKGTISLDQTRYRLLAFVPELGAKPIASITLDDIDRAKKLIPRDISVNTRRAYLLDLQRVFSLAARPLRLVERALDIEIPPEAARPLFTFLYPAEEYHLSSTDRVPFEYRFLYAWLARNGTRIGETSLITWDHVDLSQGEIHIDARWTKTKRSRYWKLDDDVLEALTLRHASLQPKPTERVFRTPRGKMIDKRLLKRRFHDDLRAAGVTRRAVFSAEPGSYALRIHDLRGSFVTLARAMGQPDRWTMDRSGHESVASFELYDRVLRHAKERGLGWYAPMARALGMRGAESGGAEWARGAVYEVGQRWATATFPAEKGTELPLNGNGPGERDSRKTPEKPTPVTEPPTLSDPRGPAEKREVGQGVAQSPSDTSALEDTPVERALAAALTSAIAEQQWELAKAIVAELGERRRERVAPGVPSFADARAKREKGNGDR